MENDRVIPALRRLSQEDFKFKARLGNLTDLCHVKQIKQTKDRELAKLLF